MVAITTDGCYLVSRMIIEANIAIAQPKDARALAVLQCVATTDGDEASLTDLPVDEYEEMVAAYTRLTLADIVSSDSQGSNRKLFVAYSGPLLVGYCNVSKGSETSSVRQGYTRIHDLAVSPRHRLQGHGSALVWFAEFYAGNSTLRADVGTDQKDAFAFFASRGFTAYGHTKTQTKLELRDHELEPVNTAAVIDYWVKSSHLTPWQKARLRRRLVTRDESLGRPYDKIHSLKEDTSN